MSAIALARRYAEGFLEFAKDSIGFKKALEELKNLKDIFLDNPEFVEFLKNPEISFTEKCGAIENILSEVFSEEARFFLQLLLKKNRFDSFNDIAEYAIIKYSHGGEVTAALASGYPIDKESLKSIKVLLEKKFEKRMHLQAETDPSLLGGIKVTVGNIVIDGSVKRRLDDLKAQLMAVMVS